LIGIWYSWNEPELRIFVAGVVLAEGKAMRWRGQIMLLLLTSLLGVAITASALAAATPRLYYFSAANCSHCQEYGPRLKALVARYPAIELVEHDIWRDRPAIQLQIDLLATYGETVVATPTVFLGDRLWIGLDDLSLAEIETAIAQCISRSCPDAMARLGAPPGKQQPPPTAADQSLDLPLIGAVEPRDVSLPLVTVVLGLLDSVNPCAFFVLLFLLSLMVHARSRGRMLIVGVVFVACSGLIYFLFMAAWLNLFLATGGMDVVTTLAGVVALGIGAVNIKDYFLLHRGPSLSIPERVKPGLYQRVRNLVQAAGYPSLLGGTVLLAIAANGYELLCTAGLPMVYTRILTLQGLPLWQYYAYLAVYNVVYVVPLLVIVVVFAMTLGSHHLSENEGRTLKLLSGLMMAEMGLVLLFAPALLNTLLGTSGLLLTALLLGGVIVVFTRRRHRE
jgi:thiol-disulfide isomerase/thioredoxin